MIDIEERHLQALLEILQKYVPDYEARVFGSRYKRTAKPTSDLDIALVGERKISIETFACLNEALEESDLPFCVDVLDYLAIGDAFKSIIDAGYAVIQKAKKVI